MTEIHVSQAAPATSRPIPARRRSGLARRDTRTAMLFLLPSLIGFVAFLLVPMVASAGLSFTNWQVIAPPRFIGLANYVKLFTDDPVFYTVLGNTLFFTAEYLVLNIIVSIGLAVWIASLRIGQRWFRVVFFMPAFTPAIAASVVWALIFTPGGLVDFTLKSLSLVFPNFLLDPRLAMQAVVIVSIWSHVGYNTVLFNAALDLVPKNYLEAARIDGASAWHRFWYIRLPLISPTVFFGTVMTAITSLQVFDQIYVMTRGGPGSATATLGFAIYQQGFQNYQMGYASSIAWVMFVMIMALTGLQFWLQRKWVHYD